MEPCLLREQRVLREPQIGFFVGFMFKRRLSEQIHIWNSCNFPGSIFLPARASTVEPINRQVGCWLNGPRQNIPEASHCAREEEEEKGGEKKEGGNDREREGEKTTVRLFNRGVGGCGGEGLGGHQGWKFLTETPQRFLCPVTVNNPPPPPNTHIHTHSGSPRPEPICPTPHFSSLPRSSSLRAQTHVINGRLCPLRNPLLCGSCDPAGSARPVPRHAELSGSEAQTRGHFHLLGSREERKKRACPVLS